MSHFTVVTMITASLVVTVYYPEDGKGLHYAPQNHNSLHTTTSFQEISLHPR